MFETGTGIDDLQMLGWTLIYLGNNTSFGIAIEDSDTAYCPTGKWVSWCDGRLKPTLFIQLPDRKLHEAVR